LIAHRGRPPVVVLAAVIFVLAGATPAIGQSAWTPVNHELSLSFVFQQINFNGHFWSDGSKHENDVASRAFLGIVQADYGLTDKLAFTARLPYVASQFTGADDPATVEFLQYFDEVRRNTAGGEAFHSLDTGDFYSTFQDLGITLRYNARSSGLVVTPVIGVTIPSHDYRTVGEAAPGSNRVSLQMGVNAGRLLEPLLPAGYVHGRYTYSLVQRLLGVRIDHSNAEFELGYALNHLFSVRGLAAWGQVHGGLPYEETLADAPLFLEHDRLLRSNYWHVGGGATFALTDALDLDAALVSFVSGTDTHYGIGVTIGAAWRFAPSVSASAAKSVASPSAPRRAGLRGRW
jgi:hypothetical protein